MGIFIQTMLVLTAIGLIAGVVYIVITHPIKRWQGYYQLRSYFEALPKIETPEEYSRLQKLVHDNPQLNLMEQTTLLLLLSRIYDNS